MTFYISSSSYNCVTFVFANRFGAIFSTCKFSSFVLSFPIQYMKIIIDLRCRIIGFLFHCLDEKEPKISPNTFWSCNHPFLKMSIVHWLFSKNFDLLLRFSFSSLRLTKFAFHYLIKCPEPIPFQGCSSWLHWYLLYSLVSFLFTIVLATLNNYLFFFTPVLCPFRT